MRLSTWQKARPDPNFHADNLEMIAKAFPAQLSDAGRQLYDPVDDEFAWPVSVPPIG